jgi:hypothetical protein
MGNQWELAVIAILLGLGVIITIGLNRWRRIEDDRLRSSPPAPDGVVKNAAEEPRRGFADPPPRPPG